MNALRPALVLALLAAAPAAARAQTVTATLDDPTRFDVLSRADCEDTNTSLRLSFTWQVSGLISTTNATQTVFITDATNCPENPGTDDDVLLDEQPVASNGAGVFGRTSDQILTPAQLFAVATEGGDGCGGAAGIDQTVSICVVIQQSGTTVSTTRARIPITLDSKPPPVPTDVEADSGESRLFVSWSMPNDRQGAAGYRVTVTPAGGGTPVVKDVVGGAVSETSVDGLQNDTTYDVTVQSRDDAGTAPDRQNFSAPSKVVQGTPAEVEDFWERYKDAGGEETGGCSTSGGALGALGLGALLLLRRRRAGAAALVATALAASPALAQDSSFDEPPLYAEPQDPAARFEGTPQYFAIELGTGPFQPGVDDEPGLTGTPFKDVFGDKTPILTRLELRVDLLQMFGRLSLGGSVGYWQVTGKALTATGERSKDDTQLKMIPLTVLAAYHADMFWKWWGIPLVPYGKLGYGFSYWETTVGDRVSSVDVGGDRQTGAGWAYGLEYAGGLQLVLDVIEPSKALQLDHEFGINSTRLFFQVGRAEWRGSSGLRLDGTTWEGGLAFAF